MNTNQLKASICIVASIGAAVVAYSGHDGWGWLITIAILALI